MKVPDELQEMLAGGRGSASRMGARLVVDMASSAGTSEFIKISNAHVSGVSVITGGHGLRRFLSDLTMDSSAHVAIPTTLNSAGCDRERISEMRIDWPDFLEHQFEIISAYEILGIEATLSCTPYDRGIDPHPGIASWAESNAVCFTNSYSSLFTNRESGLSALASALTGYAPLWGLHLESNRIPNMRVRVECELTEPADFSVLGDWIGKQVKPELDLPWGPMPFIEGLQPTTGFSELKALTAAAANYGCPMLWVDGISTPPESIGFQTELVFDESELQQRYADLAPSGEVDLVVIGCPQASLNEIRATASEVRARMEFGERIPDNRLWVFTSAHNYELGLADGSIYLLEEAGALVLKDTCPEVTPYNPAIYRHLLTNSLKAEHYLTSGLNRLPTSVARLKDCIAHAFNPSLTNGPRPSLDQPISPSHLSSKKHRTGELVMRGKGLPSQSEWSIRGRALVTDVPITYLGYVNRDTGIIEESGHPLDGEQIKDSILVYPKGSGSTVAPFVLMGLTYTGMGPKAVINRDVCPLTLPACSLLDVPYGHGFDTDPCVELNSGDHVELSLSDGVINLTVLERVAC